MKISSAMARQISKGGSVTLQMMMYWKNRVDSLAEEGMPADLVTEIKKLIQEYGDNSR